MNAYLLDRAEKIGESPCGCSPSGCILGLQQRHPPPRKMPNPASARIGWVQDKGENLVSARCRDAHVRWGGFVMPKNRLQNSPKHSGNG